jgi:hypothetical protein
LVNGTQNADNQAVKWELVDGSYATGTSLSNTDYTTDAITLTAGTTETVAANQITLQATSQEGAVKQTVKVTVTVKQPTLEDTSVGGYYTDKNGIVWMVLAEENGNKLIMTRYVYGITGTVGTKYTTTDSWNHLDTPGNNLKSALQTFYTTIGDDTKAKVLPYQQPLPDVNDKVSSSWTTTGAAGKSHPGSGTVPLNGSNAVFVLSITEASTYPPLDTNEKRKAYDVNDKSTIQNWWYRSPGSSTSTPLTCTNVSGMVALTQVDFNVRSGYRPALWVKPDK